MSKRKRSVILWCLVALIFYCDGYWFARWRNCIVMVEYCDKENQMVVRETWPGVEYRDDWRGRFKNSINEPLFYFFRPLTLLENVVHGGTRPIK